MAWVKAFHIFFMVTWFAGLFYLPRLFVYHADTRDPISLARFGTMERRLFIMMTIGGLGTLVFGLWLLFGYSWQAFGHTIWLKTKLILVGLLVAYHLYCFKLIRQFREQKNQIRLE